MVGVCGVLMPRGISSFLPDVVEWVDVEGEFVWFMPFLCTWEGVWPCWLMATELFFP